jgi:DNA polymerase-1
VARLADKEWNLREHMLRRFRHWNDVEAIWLLDFEFATENERPIPVCLCAKDILSERRIEMFFHDGERPENPFDDYEHSVFVGHSIAAEWSCFIALGWDLPPNCVDTMFEFACLTNQKVKRDLITPYAQGRSLIDACDYFEVSTMGSESKSNERQNIIDHCRLAPPGIEQSDYERRVLDYCWEDVDITALLFVKMVKLLDSSQAMLRGSYSRAVAWYQRNGLPLNMPWVRKVVKYRDQIKLELVRRIEEEHKYGAYKITDGEAVFDMVGASLMIERLGLAKYWPRSPKTQKFSFAKTVVEDFAKSHTELMPFYELRKTDSAMKNFMLSVTDDGSNRTYVAPLGQKAGRNNPGGGFILAGPKWLRYGIQAPPGHALVVCDVKSEEYVLAAAFAEDQAELEAYYSGRDLYLAVAIRLGAVPPEANHKTEPDLKKRKYYVAVRKKFKTLLLGTQYGQGPAALAIRLGVSLLEAQIIVAELRRLRKRYWDWSDAQIAMARKRGYIETVFGWRMYVYPQIRRGSAIIGTKTTTIVNWPVQAAGGEILRVASILLEKSGYGSCLCAPHHDAIYAFASLPKASEVASAIEAAFVRAGDIVMNGRGRLLVETGFYPHPHGYEDEDGAELFRIVDGFLSELPEVTDEEWAVLQTEMQKKIDASKRKKRSAKKIV